MLYNELVKYLSEDRLKPYLIKTGYNLKEAIELYKINLEYSSQLYKVLSLFEVFLRNAINNELITIDINWILKLDNIHIQILNRLLGTSMVAESTIQNFKNIFNIQENLIKDAYDSLILDKRPITNGYLISRLTFGFWTRFFNKVYEDMLYKKYLYKIFNSRLNRQKAEHLLNEFRWLRNRIAHNEPILYMKHKPQKYYEKIMEFTESMNSNLIKIIKDTVSQDLFS